MKHLIRIILGAVVFAIILSIIYLFSLLNLSENIVFSVVACIVFIALFYNIGKFVISEYEDYKWRKDNNI